MKAYKALITLNLRLALREKSVIFFNYLFPLIFFFIFGQAMHAERGAAMTIVISMVLIIGILGNGLFGAGIRSVQEREANILRRYKVTPITPAPLLIASAVTGWILYMPNVLLIFALAHFMYGMPWPQSMGSILIFITVAIIGFRAIGLILASVVNSMQESQLLVQLVYLPMLFLSGATFPLSMFPPWLLVVTQFVPATYMVVGIQGMLLRDEGIGANIQPTLALALTAFVGLFISYKLFRWEKEEKMRASAKLWLAAVLTPFLLLGTWQMHARTGIAKNESPQPATGAERHIPDSRRADLCWRWQSDRKWLGAGARRQNRTSIRRRGTGPEDVESGDGGGGRQNNSSRTHRRSHSSWRAGRFLSRYEQV